MKIIFFPHLEIKPKSSKFVFASFLVALTAGVAIFIFYSVPVSGDWQEVFYPAGQAFFSGKSPYIYPGFFNPPWTLIFLAPFFLFPEHVSATFVVLMQLVAFGFVAFKLGAKPLGIAAVVLSEPVLIGSIYGNIEWLVVLGLIMPPQIGLFFVMLKPQLGIGIAIYWLWKAWREKGIRGVIRVFAPVTMAFLFSLAIYGFYPLHFSKALGFVWNFSLFPYGILIGVGLLIYAFWKNQPHSAAASGIFFSPYVNVISYSISSLAFIQSTFLTVLICGLSWLLLLIPILYSSFLN